MRRPSFNPGETVQWRIACNRQQGGLARGGLLWLTSEALVFEPHRFDARTGGQGRRIPLRDIAEVTVSAGGDAPSLSGGLRPRLRLDLRNGEVELLLVNKIMTRLREIQVAVACVE